MRNSFFYHLMRTFWVAVQYLLVSALVMLVTLSFTTGKFPPPVKDVYQDIRRIQSTMDVSKATTSIAQAKKEQIDTLRAIELSENVDYRPAPPQAPARASARNLEDRVRILENEILKLRAQMSRLDCRPQQPKIGTQADLRN